MTIYFHSNAKPPFNKLSNFHDLTPYFIVINSKSFNTTEAAFQSFHKIHPSHHIHFQVGGKFASWNGMNTFFQLNDATKKITYWSYKNNLGIVAKLASNPKYRSKTHLHFINSNDKYHNIFQGYINDWAILLLHKFNLPKFKFLLLQTENCLLVEYDRIGNPQSFWGGKIINNTLIGQNAMGQMLMFTRDIILLKSKVLQQLKLLFN